MGLDYFAGILAEDDGFGLLQFIFFAVIFGLSVLGSIFTKKKESDEKARRQAQPQQPQRPAPPRQEARPARPQPQERPDEGQAGAVEALRQALGWSQPAPRQAPPPLPAQQRAAARHAAPPPARPMPRPQGKRKHLDATPAMTHHETVGEHQFHAPMDLMEAEGPVRDIGAMALPVAPAHHPASVPFGAAGDLRRGIVYAEVLGPPKALRRGPDSWEL